MRTQIQVIGKQNYGSCESCKAVKQANDDKAEELNKINLSQENSNLNIKTIQSSKNDPRLSSVLSNSKFVQKSWPPLTNQSGGPENNNNDYDDEFKNKKTALQRAADTIPCLGIMLALCASVFLGSAGMLVKMTRSVHGIQVAVFR